MLVGEAPGGEESLALEPFVGKAGKINDKLLERAGSSREEVSIANTLPCYLPGNPTPTPYEMNCCAGVLREVIEQANPKVLLALGSIPTARLVGQRSISAWRGSVFQTPKHVKLGEHKIPSGVVYKTGVNKGLPKLQKADLILTQDIPQQTVITLHPAELGYTGFREFTRVLVDYKRALKLAKDGKLKQVGPENPPDFHNQPPIENILDSTAEIVLDLETIRGTSKITLIGIALSPTLGYVYEPTPEVFFHLAKWLENPDNLLIGQNLAFDIKVLESNGFTVKNRLYDTMHAAHFLRPDLPKGLDDLASILPNHHYYNWKEAFRTGVNYDEKYYCLLDVCWTYQIYDNQCTLGFSQPKLAYFQNILMKALPVLIKMEQAGVQIDLDKLAELKALQEANLASLEASWKESYPSTNHRSSKQLMEIFYKTLSLRPILKRSKTGSAPTLDEDALEKLAEHYPNTPGLVNLSHMRHVEGILSKYLDIRTKLDKNGRLYPQYNMSGTAFGRISGGGDEGFNFQNIPRSGKACPKKVPGCICYRIRELFVGDDGAQVAVGDYSQIEFRISAVLAKENIILEAYKAGPFDVHQDVANKLNITRQEAKPIVHGSNFGMGASTLAKHAKITVVRAKQFLAALMSIYPNLTRWRLEAVKFAEKFGYLVNPFGRTAMLRVTEYGKIDAPKAIAFGPQSCAADLMYHALIEADKRNLAIRWVVHDEIGISVTTPYSPDELRLAMEIPIPQLDNFVCPADIHVGANWADAKS